MKVRKNITGEKFGRLKVVRLANEEELANYKGVCNGAKWYCECECGGTKIVPTPHLTSGTCKSCGCLAKEANIKNLQTQKAKESLLSENKKRRYDLEGQKSGFLTYHKEAGIVNNQRMIECICQCGNIKITLAERFISGRLKSCGCYHKMIMKEKMSEIGKAGLQDLTGMKFNKWTVIKRVENRGKEVYWLCQCECGNIHEVAGPTLRRGNSRQCQSCANKSRGEKSKGNTYRRDSVK